MNAIRVLGGYRLEEFDVPPSGVLAVAERDESDESHEREAVGFLWRRAREQGVPEAEFRATLPSLGPERYAELEELPEYEPPTTVTPAEAQALMDLNVAEAVD